MWATQVKGDVFSTLAQTERDIEAYNEKPDRRTAVLLRPCTKERIERVVKDPLFCCDIICSFVWRLQAAAQRHKGERNSEVQRVYNLLKSLLPKLEGWQRQITALRPWLVIEYAGQAFYLERLDWISRVLEKELPDLGYER